MLIIWALSIAPSTWYTEVFITDLDDVPITQSSSKVTMDIAKSSKTTPIFFDQRHYSCTPQSTHVLAIQLRVRFNWDIGPMLAQYWPNIKYCLYIGQDSPSYVWYWPNITDTYWPDIVY